MSPDGLELNKHNVLANLGRTLAEYDALDKRVISIIAAARGFGWTWQKIGDTLGTSRQAAWERYAAAVGAERAGSGSD
jgi:hypothetical protein